MSSPPIETGSPSQGVREAVRNGHLASVIPLATSPALGRRSPRGAPLGWAILLIAAGLAASPLASGYFDFSIWGPITLGLTVVLVVVGWAARPVFTRPGVIASGGLAAMLALSAGSMLWAESKASAWTSVSRLSLYAMLFGIVLLAGPDRRIGRLTMLILASAALLTCAVLCVVLVFGGGQHAFLTRRLNSPIGYINGTAGLLAMGLWPWLAWAETAPRRGGRALALAGASLIAGTMVLTQSRAVLPATILTGIIVLLCAPERTRRAINLVLVGASVAVGLPWTLAVYSDGGLAGRVLLPSHGVLRGAALAILASAAVAGLIRFAITSLAQQLRPERLARTIRALGAVLGASAVVLAAGGLVAGSSWISRQYREFTAVKVNPDASVRFVDASGFRYDLWRVALHEFRAHPLVGVGAGNYDVDYYRLRQNPDYVIQPHSLELQFAAELGIGGIAALLVFCGAVLYAGFARRGTLASNDRMIRIAALGMFSAWLIDTSVDWLYDIPGLAGMAVVAAGLLVVPATVRRAGRRSRTSLVAGVLALGVLALLAASVGRQYVASRYQEKGARQVSSAPRAAIGTLKTAEELNPYSLATLYPLAAAYARLNDYRDARAVVLAAARREPHNYVPPALLGDLAMRRGDYRLAVSEYQRALALNPRDLVTQQSKDLATAALR